MADVREGGGKEEEVGSKKAGDPVLGFPSIDKLDLFVRIHDELLRPKGKEWVFIKEVAASLGKPYPTCNTAIAAVHSFLGGREIIDATSGNGVKIKTLQPKNRLVEQMREIVARAKVLREEVGEYRLKVAISPMLSIRMLSPLIACYKACKVGSADRAEIDVVSMSPGELMTEAHKANAEYDLVITFGEPNALSRPHLRTLDGSTSPSHAYRCILARRGSSFVREYRDRISKGEFNYEWLSGVRVAALPPDKKIPGFPDDKVSRHAIMVWTGSSLDAHALVRSGVADITFSHVDLLSDIDLRSLCYIDLEPIKNDNLGCGHIYPIKLDRGVLKKSEEAIRTGFYDHVARYFRDIDDRHSESRAMTKNLKRFKHSYHVSYKNVRGMPTRAWFEGHLDLEACVLQRERPEPTRYVGGSYTFVDEPGRNPLLFFGKITDMGKNGVRRLWRGSLTEDDSVGFSFAFDEKDLSRRTWLCGTWAGRPTLVDRDEVQVFGFMILSTTPLAMGRLIAIAGEFKDNDDAKARFEGLNPLSGWELPEKFSRDF